jgi:integrase
LFAFARDHGYLAKDDDELREITAGSADPGEIEICTPKEMAAMMAVAFPELVPAMGLGGFAGLRSKEIERLDWSEVQLGRGFIELKRSKTKTAQRRLVPIQPNLAQWLAPYAQESGPVWAYSTAQLGKLKAETAEAAGLVWRHNALRHSFASYRLAQLQNASQVALETGHTVKVLFSNYRELVTPDEAKAWFAIAPEASRPIEIYSPEEMRALLGAVCSELIPAVALCGFSGLSPSEVEQLDWREVDLERGVIEVKPVKPGKEVKTQLLLPNMAGWLGEHRRTSGPVWPKDRRSMAEVLKRTAQEAGIAWKENGLSDSYVGYRFALIPDAAQVASETGRSPHTVFASFHEVVTGEEAKSWFGIMR